MLNKSVVAVGLAVLGISNVRAECTGHSCAAEYVERLYVNSDSGLVYVATSGDESKLDCNAVTGVYATLDLAEPGAAAIYSTLLSAQVAEKKVQIRIVNGSSNCKIKYLTLDRQ